MNKELTTRLERYYLPNEYYCFYDEMRNSYSDQLIDYLEGMYIQHKDRNPGFLNNLKKALEDKVQWMNEIVVGATGNLTLENFSDYKNVVKPALEWIAKKQQALAPSALVQVTSEPVEETIELIQLRRTDSMRMRILFTIYNSLNTICFNISFEAFESHFANNGYAKNGKPLKKIRWEGSEPEITLLINELSKNVITTRAQYKLITEHFVKKTGKPFNNKQLGISYSKALLLKDYPVIDSLINELNKLVLG